MFFSNKTNNKQNSNINPYSSMATLAFKYSAWFGICASIILVFYAMGVAGCGSVLHIIHSFFNVLGIAIIIALAAFAFGGIIGFLFGIPHTNQPQQNNTITAPAAGTPPSPGVPVAANTNANTNVNTSINPNTQVQPQSISASNITANRPASNYTPSTNLEQIADWLTKIIIGVGLVQIHKIITQFNILCLSLGSSLDSISNIGCKNLINATHSGPAVVGALVISFFIDGFLIVYLWTRWYLIGIQNSMDDIMANVDAKLQISDVNDKSAIDAANTQLNLPDNKPDIPVNDLYDAFKYASGNVISSIFFKTVSVRKQNWKDDIAKSKMERVIPILQALIKLDSNFEFPENYAELGYALKDKRVPDYQGALTMLDKAISGFNNNDNIANKAITYFNRAYCRIKLDQNFLSNTASTDANKTLINSDLLEAGKEKYVANIIASDQDVTKWQKINIT